MIKCYKTLQAPKSSRKYIIAQAALLEALHGENELTIQIRKTKKIKIKLFPTTDPKAFMEVLNRCRAAPFKPKKKILKQILNIPYKISTGVITGLEKIGDGARNTPNSIFERRPKANKGASPIQSSEEKDKKKNRNPQTITQGLAMGTESMVTELAGAVFGLVAEPFKGAKKGGLKGATKGIGKGVVGLIFKPVAGTIDLVTCTAKGIGNTPKTIYKNLFKIEKKGESNTNQADLREMELIAENDQEKLYVKKDSQIAKQLITQGGKSTSFLEYKQKYEEEKTKREKLQRLINEMSGRIDPNLSEKNREFLQNIQDISRVISCDQVEEVKDEQDITNIIKYYENGMNESNEIKEDFEFLFISKPEGPLVIDLEAEKKPNVIKKETIDFSESDSQEGDDSNLPHFKKDEYDPENPNNFSIDEEEEEDDEEDDDDSSDGMNEQPRTKDLIPANIQFDFNKIQQYISSPIKSSFAHTNLVNHGREPFLMTVPSPRNREALGFLKVNKPGGDIHDEEELRRMPSAELQKELEALQKDVRTGVQQEVEGMMVQGDAEIVTHPQTHAGLITVQKEELVGLNEEEMRLINSFFELIEDLDREKINAETYPFDKARFDTNKNTCQLSDVIWPEDVLFNLPKLDYTGEELVNYLKNWKPYEDKADTRVIEAYEKGGRLVPDPVIKKYRSIGKGVVGTLGKKLLTGHFSLAGISFPIKAMIGMSYLEKIAVSTCFAPLYLNLAVKTKDIFERFKLYVIASIAYYYMVEAWAKPLNPILGETCSGFYSDGTRVYLEQISHNPQATYLLMEGPKHSYSFFGPAKYAPSLNTTGWRKIVFHDTKQEIKNNFPDDLVENTLFGKCQILTVGSMEFKDEQNKISLKIDFGKEKKKAADYFSGDFVRDGKKAGRIYGTYMGWTEIDGVRFFDHRFASPFKFHYDENRIGSDFRNRKDLQLLRVGEIEQAQKAKEELEVLQRGDRKLREKFAKSEKKKK